MNSKILEKKQKAAEYFTKKLLASKAGKDIAKVILFGSVARGEADDYSDIDLLVFCHMPGRVREELWKVLVDAYEEYEESIEPLVYKIKEYEKPDSYFLYQSIKKGKQLYPGVAYAKRDQLRE